MEGGRDMRGERERERESERGGRRGERERERERSRAILLPSSRGYMVLARS
jgi:hypothetical protein